MIGQRQITNAGHHQLKSSNIQHSFRFLTHGSQLYSSNIPPAHRSESNPHSQAGVIVDGYKVLDTQPFGMSRNLSGQGPSICCRRPLRCLKAPLGLLLPRLRWGRAVQVLLSAVIAKGKMSYKTKKTAAKSCLPCGAVKQSKSEPFPSDAASVASPRVTVCVPSL